MIPRPSACACLMQFMQAVFRLFVRQFDRAQLFDSLERSECGDEIMYHCFRFLVGAYLCSWIVRENSLAGNVGERCNGQIATHIAFNISDIAGTHLLQKRPSSIEVKLHTNYGAAAAKVGSEFSQKMLCGSVCLVGACRHSRCVPSF